MDDHRGTGYPYFGKPPYVYIYIYTYIHTYIYVCVCDGINLQMILYLVHLGTMRQGFLNRSNLVRGGP